MINCTTVCPSIDIKFNTSPSVNFARAFDVSNTGFSNKTTETAAFCGM